MRELRSPIPETNFSTQRVPQTLPLLAAALQQIRCKAHISISGSYSKFAVRGAIAGLYLSAYSKLAVSRAPKQPHQANQRRNSWSCAYSKLAVQGEIAAAWGSAPNHKLII